MNSVPCADSVCPAMYACAQGGCVRCLHKLMRAHAGLVWLVLRRTRRGEMAWADLEQEGRIALWRAILGYDAQRGIAFSTYGVRVIERQLWQVVQRAERQDVRLVWQGEARAPGAEVVWEEWQQEQQVRMMVARLPERLQGVVVGVYGLGGEPALSLAALGRQWSLSRERIRQLRNDALVLLRLQVLAGVDTGLPLDQRRRRHLRQLNRVWLQRGRP